MKTTSVSELGLLWGGWRMLDVGPKEERTGNKWNHKEVRHSWRVFWKNICEYGTGIGLARVEGRQVRREK